MTLLRALVGTIVAVWILGIAAMELGSAMSLPGVTGTVAPAQAVVGRPLTPVSVAGVARRTVRRCAVGVYRC
jgi:hypothetical protein